ncbi:hypothetical protein DT076_06785 [Desertihabitans brevis]|uniref:Uncharacterized protein n=1 Tax=Desertihabitans brevis TaxID=2268447 RepID=A0A367YZH6_9ACTN|nr:hypothetical protein [Desertihabitans brevis]RCK70351.1 hypothetical protein DT076_06785 [Desertihabitans brevis]
MAEIGLEAARLGAEALRLWARLWPQLLGVLLLGWAGRHAALLLSAEVTDEWPWLVVPTVALGLVAVAASTVVALRLAATSLGVERLLQAAGEAADPDDRDRSPLRLLTVVLLPFLAVYTAFGHAESLAGTLVNTTQLAQGLGAPVLVALDPTGSGWTVLGVSVVLVGLFLLRRVVDRLYRRTGQAVLGLLTVLVEACFLFLVLLSGFRLLELLRSWWSERRLLGWWSELGADLAAGFAVLRVDLPAVWDRAVELWSTLLWPVVWERLSEPVAWLALAALVFGSRVLSLADVWQRMAESAPAPVARPRLRDRLHRAAASATGVRRVALQVQQVLLGDVDDKYLPTWQSLRLVLRAGLGLLGGYLVAFTALQLLALLLDHLLTCLVGPSDVGLWALLQPFLTLDSDVLVMSLQVSVLAVAFSSALSRFAVRAGAVPATPAGVRPSIRVGAASRLGVAVLLCTLLGLASVVLRQQDEAQLVRAAVGETADVSGRLVTVSAPRFGQRLLREGGQEVEATSELAIVVVPVELVAPGPAGAPMTADLVSDRRRYDTQFGLGQVDAEAGYRTRSTFVFEIDPDDIRPGLGIEVRPLEIYRGYNAELRVDLGLDAGSAQQLRSDLVDAPVECLPAPLTEGLR